MSDRWFEGPARGPASSSLLSPLGRKPNCPSSAWSSSNRLPTVKQMWSASARVRSCHDVSCVPQYPQNCRRAFAAKGEMKVRWMLERVSSGNWAKVAEVYQVRGTRSHSVTGFAECWPESHVSPLTHCARIERSVSCGGCCANMT